MRVSNYGALNSITVTVHETLTGVECTVIRPEELGIRAKLLSDGGLTMGPN